MGFSEGEEIVLTKYFAGKTFESATGTANTVTHQSVVRDKKEGLFVKNQSLFSRRSCRICWTHTVYDFTKLLILNGQTRLNPI